MKIDSLTRRVSLDPQDPEFVQDPYPFYSELQARCPVFYWEEYGFWCLAEHAAVHRTLRDRRWGRQILHLATREELGWEAPPQHLAPFLAFESHSLLELEPPVHTRLRGLVNRAFVSRQIAHLRPRIEAYAHTLLDELLGTGRDEVDLLAHYATPIPVAVICWLLGVPESMGPQLLRWSHAMVAMYQANRDRQVEDVAVEATLAFSACIRELVQVRRTSLGSDLLSDLIRAQDGEGSLSEDELVTTAILLLNAGHEATVHTLGNGIHALLAHPLDSDDGERGMPIRPETVEEILRFDPPLHMFTRYALEDLEVDLAEGVSDRPCTHAVPFKKGERVGLLLGAANRDPKVFSDPHAFSPERFRLERPDSGSPPSTGRHVSFGGGIHYCLGAPLARLELEVALSVLFQRVPGMKLVHEPTVANRYHFRGLEALRVRLEG